MNFQKGDIFVRKRDGKTTVYISQRLIIEVCGLSEEYLKKARSLYKKSIKNSRLAEVVFLPDTGKSWRWTNSKGVFYYAIDNIPNKAPNHYRSLFGDTDTLVKSWKESNHNTKLSKLETAFNTYVEDNYKDYLSYYNGTEEVKRQSLAKACSALAFIVMQREKGYEGTKSRLFHDMSIILASQNFQYLPHYHKRLKDKADIIRDTDHSITDLIYQPRKGVQNALKYNDPVLFGWFYHLRANGANFSNIHIIRQVWEACERTGRQKPSESWCKDFLSKASTKFLTAEKRFGSSKHSNIYKSYIPFEDALNAGDCWQIDATRINIIAHESKDKEGNKIQKHLMAVAVRDVMSGDILGYYLTYSENKTSFAKALQMAVNRAGYLPYEIVTDKFPGYNTQENKILIERLESLGVKVRFTHLATDKASVERWFGTFQSVVLMGSKYYYGEGITSKRITAHRSPEYLENLKKESKRAGFDVYTAVEECEGLFEYWRDLKYSRYSRKHKNLDKSPKELHNESEKAHTIPVSKLNISMLFDRKTEVTIRNSGQFHIEVMGVKYHYMISENHFDIISNYQNERVVVSYDMEDLSEVYLWKKQEHFLISLCSVKEFKKIIKYGPNAELGRISQAKARQRKIKEMQEVEYNKVVSGVGEEALLMGIHTKKDEVNAFEDEYSGISWNIPIKQKPSEVEGDKIASDKFNESKVAKILNL